MDNQYFGYYKSPIGSIKISYTGNGISSLVFIDKEVKSSYDDLFLQSCFFQLDEYFSGKRKVFELRLDINGTDFQVKVWKSLLSISYGHTVSYGEIAKQMGNGKLMRAVGNANGKNPVSIIVPCHRVVGKDGSLTGYAGGLWRKQWLLDHEFRCKQLSLF